MAREGSRKSTNRKMIAQFLYRVLSGREWPKNAVVVDVGCGEGPYKEVLTRTVGQSAVVMYLDREQRGSANVLADAYNVPLKANSADLVLAIEVIEHLPDGHAAIREWSRVLKPGGWLLITCPFMHQLHELPRDFARYTPFWFHQAGEQEGLSLVEVCPRGGLVTVICELARIAVHALSEGCRRKVITRPLGVLIGLVEWICFDVFMGTVVKVMRLNGEVRRWNTGGAEYIVQWYWRITLGYNVVLVKQ